MILNLKIVKKKCAIGRYLSFVVRCLIAFQIRVPRQIDINSVYQFNTVFFYDNAALCTAELN